MRLFKAYVCRILPALLMAGVVFLLFARSASFSYIGIDDAAYTFRNPFVASGLTLDGIVEAFSNFRHGGIWMPVTYIMYMIDFSVCKLFGFPLMAAMHVVNALLHAVNFLLLLRLMRRLVLGCGNGENGICDLQWGRHDSATTEHTEGFICDLQLKCGARSRSGDAASASHAERNCAPQFSRDGEGAVATPRFADGFLPHRIRAQSEIVNRKSEILPTTNYQSGKDSASPFPGLPCIPWFSFNRKSCQLPTTNYQLPTINRKSNLWWLFTMLFCVLACLSKPTAMCFPFLAMLVEWLVSRSRIWEVALCDGEERPYRDRCTAHHCSGNVSPLPLPTTHCPLPTSNYSIANRKSINRKSPPTTNYQLPTIHYQLLLLLPALIWALHPLRAEPVAWIAARKELLWTSFTLLGLLCWTNMLYRRPQITNSESGVAEPVSRWPIVSRLLPYLPMLVVAGATAAIAAYSQTHVAGQGDTSLYAASFGHRLVNALSAIGFYIRTTFWPVGLHIDCRAVNSLMPLGGVANLAVLAGVCLGFVIYGLLRLRSRVVVARTLGKEAESFPLQDGERCCPQWKRLGSRFSLGGGDAASASHAERNCAPQFSRDGEGAVATPRFADGFLPHRIRAQSEIENTTHYPLPTTHYQSGKDSASPFSRLPCFSCIPWFSFNRKSEILPTTNYQLPTTNYFFSFLWFMIGLLPTLGIFGGFGIESHADRFTYLPMMGFSFLLAAWLVDLARRDGDARRLRVVNWILAIAVVLLAVTSFRQLGFWKDNAEAYGRALACDSGHPRAMVHVADALCSRRRNFDAGIAMYRKALSLADTVPEGGFNIGDVRARLAYALASRGGYDDFGEVKRLGADVLRNFRLDRRGMMLDALGTAFMNEGDLKRAAVLFRASIDAPDRFWPKASTKRKLEMCR